MSRGAVVDAVQEADLVRLRAPVRRYLARVVPDEHDLDDLVQETLLRLWEVRGRVDRAGAAAYAVATARNLEASRRRAYDLHDRHAHRLHEPGTVDGPESETLRREEHRAVADALAGLEADDRALLAEEYGDGDALDVERSARRRSRLARARSRARVDYLLRLRHLDLPTAQCRPVLEALSSGDRREQARAGVEHHLLRCRTCVGCADALVSRERSLFGVVALPVLTLLVLLRSSPRTSAGVGAAVAVAATAGVLLVGRQDPPPPAPRLPPAPATVTTAAAPPAPAPTADGPVLLSATTVPADLGASVGRTVVARDVLVLSVPADEGFFVGPDDAHRVFVRLVQSGESSLDVRPGQHVTFRGRVAPADVAALDGVDAAEGRGAAEAARGVVTATDGDLVLR